jgi:glucose/arabinose dehydrogenase
MPRALYPLRLPVLARVVLACLIAVGLAMVERSVAQPSAAPSASQAPAISKVSPRVLRRAARLTISGKRFVKGRRRNTVTFLGRRGRKDDVKVKVTARTTRKISFRAPRARISAAGPGAVSGPIRLANRLGRSRATRIKVTFDDDGDGLSNEREISLGTNPRVRDTDGDGAIDGKDADPLRKPGAGGGSTGGGGGATVTPPPNYTCLSPGPARAGTGPASSLAGHENLELTASETRALIAHGSYAGGDFRALCLRRKRRGAPDSAFQLVGQSASASAGQIKDDQRIDRNEDYEYRTDVVTTTGQIAGVKLGVRGAAKVSGVNGWTHFGQNCGLTTSDPPPCGSSSVQAGSLRSSTEGDGLGAAGDTAGQVAVFNRRIGLTPRTFQGTLVTTRVLTPLKPTEPGTHVGAQLNLSDAHPAALRDSASGTVGDLLHAPGPWITVELRTTGDGEVRVVAKDSSAAGADKVIAQSGDLLAGGPLDNVFLTVQLKSPNRYEVRYKPNTADPDVDTVLDLDPGGAGTDRALPAGLTAAWLSLDGETSRKEDAAHDVRFDLADAVYTTNYDELEESFGGVAVPIQLPLGFQADAIAANLLGPTAIAFAPSGDMYIAERDGKVKVRDADTGATTEVLDITGQVNSGPNDQGLLGLALDPGFATNGLFYLAYTVQKDDAFNDRTVSRVERFKVGAGGTADPADPMRKTLVGSDAPAPGEGDSCPPSPTSDCLPSDVYTHATGDLEFGADGKLWITTPDGASPDGTGDRGTDPLALRAINPDSLAGKVLRIDPATGEGVSGNPGFSSESDKKSPRARTWAMGFRNPFRFAQRPGSVNGKWYVTDVGWGAWEELDVVPGAATPGSVPNFGWPCYEGTPESPYKDVYPVDCAFPGPVPPIHEYDSSGTDHAIIGSSFYSGNAYPAPWNPDESAGEASFFYSDYPSGQITMVKTNGNDQQIGNAQTFAGGFPGAVMITEGPADPANAGTSDKALYVVSLGPFDVADGKVWRITYTG